MLAAAFSGWITGNPINKIMKIMSYQSYNTLFIGKVFLCFPLLKSTNKYALNLLSKSNPTEGTVISAAHQVAGSGQYGSSWEAEKGKNITLSVILYPHFLAIRQQFMLNKAVSLAVWDWARAYLPTQKIKLKWPNDLYAGDRKLGGILIQNSLKGMQLSSSVIGIGLNVNQINFQLAPNPISLTVETGKSYHIEELSMHLCKALEIRYLQLREGRWAVLDADYLAALYRFEEMAKFKDGVGEVFEGKIIGVEDAGKLRVETGAGVRSFAFKEVVFL